MKQKWLPRLLLAAGLLPFLLPLLLSGTRSVRWSLFDWLLLYSAVYWQSYLLGLALIALALWLRRRTPR